MSVRTTVRPAPEDVFPIHPAYGYRMRRQRDPVGVRRGHGAPPGDPGWTTPRGTRYAPATRCATGSWRGPWWPPSANPVTRRRTWPASWTAADGRAGAPGRLRPLHQRSPRPGRAQHVHRRRRQGEPRLVPGPPGQTIELRPDRQCRAPVVVAVVGHAEGETPPYLEMQPDRFAATLTREPQRQEVPALRDVPLAVQTIEGSPL